MIDDFLKDLNEKEKKKWDLLEEKRIELSCMSQKEEFIRGFRLGALLMLETIEGKKGDFQ